MARRYSNKATRTALTVAAGEADSTLTVGDTTGWPAPGAGDVAVAALDVATPANTEIVTYTGKTATTLTGVARGLDGTTARPHASGVAVVHAASALDVEAAGVAIPKALVDAKGDLLVGTANDTVARLPVGVTTGHVLTVDPAEATGLKFAAAGGSNVDLSIPFIRRHASVAALADSTGVQASGGILAIVQAGSVTSVNDADGPWHNLASGATSGNNGGWSASGFLRREWDTDGLFVIKPVSLSVCRYWVGFVNNLLTADDPAVAVAAFRYSTTADSGARWRAYTNDASGTGTVTDTGVAITSGTAQKLRVSMRGGFVKFYINEVEVASHTTDLPAGATILQYVAHVTTLEAVAKSIKLARIQFAFNG